MTTRLVEIGGRRIASLMWASANRDEAVFGDPDEFRLDCGSAQSAQRVRKPNERKQFACAMLRGAWCQLQGFLGHFRNLPWVYARLRRRTLIWIIFE